jgi:putative DNA primase/helicase
VIVTSGILEPVVVHDPVAFARKALEDEVATVAGCPKGRNNQLHLSALKLGSLAGPGLLSLEEIWSRLYAAGQACGLGQDGDPGEIARAIRNGLAAGQQHPRKFVLARPNEQQPATATAPGAPARSAVSGKVDFSALSLCDLGIVNAGSIAPEATSWLWSKRIAGSRTTLIAGPGGLGKSLLACSITASITTGSPFPDGTVPGAPAPVLWLGAEDGAADTTIPRLRAAGACVERVQIVQAKAVIWQDNRAVIHIKTFQDLDYWRAVLEKTQPVLLVADPVTGHLGKGVNDHRNSDVRSVLEPFADLLSEHGTALLAISHLGKGTEQRHAMDRILGSVAYANLSRSVFVVGRDPEDQNKQFLFHVKSNNAPLQKPIAYQITEATISHGAVEIPTCKLEFSEAPEDIDANEVLNSRPRKRGSTSGQGLADALWLLERLQRDARPVALMDLIDEAGALGMLGKYDPDKGRWSNLTRLYRARDRIEKLEAPHDGWIVKEVPPGWGLRVGDGPKPRKYWQVFRANEAPAPSSEA